ncbi:ANTAR domain-containing protein [Nocardioides currus]|uniref:Transcription antitermination regulator n=1 Tax=Nocardioides currus TaxID=2133958 RepID=A0A2R7YUZ2_9ACTN|nr:ANTAR domain-containing protein [Nocardioides currus]PUA80151.1 transcription antitermination regulator [Nocardioides currus]
MATDESVLEASRQLADALRPGTLDQTLENITAAAVQVLPEVEQASITVRHTDGRLETFAPTSEMLLELDAAQYDLREGPCYDAATDRVHVLAPFLATDSRFPQYAREAEALGVQAQAGIRLFDTPTSSGALNLYASQPGRFEELGAIGELFTHQSATALAYAYEITNLTEAMRSRQRIGQAVGAIMERYDLDDARAFGFLARLSQDNNIKLRDVAETLLVDMDERRSEQG